MNRTNSHANCTVDVAIFGGGVAGLWMLDEVIRRGYTAVLFETDQLGGGQTVCAQGILHGGLKYTLKGLLTSSAKHIREMPALWRKCLEGNAGNDGPDLRATRVRADFCFLWRTEKLRSKLGMIGAQMGLRIAPQSVDANEIPDVLSRCPGTISRIDEQVVDPVSLLRNLASRHLCDIRHIDSDSVHFNQSENGEIESVDVTSEHCSGTFSAGHFLFAAGRGNAELLQRAKLPCKKPVMQLRPLHMAVVRGSLPNLNGHCVDGAKTRVTITSDHDSAGTTVWQLGGQLAEDGVEMSRDELITHAGAELASVLPGIDLSDCEWTTYRVDRAEGAVRGNKRPDTIQVNTAGNTITAWPTKMVLAPQLAMHVADALSPPQGLENTHHHLEWPRPTVSPPPWETASHWQSLAESRPSAAAA